MDEEICRPGSPYGPVLPVSESAGKCWGFSKHLPYSHPDVPTFEHFGQKGPGTPIFFKMSKHHVRKETGCVS